MASFHDEALDFSSIAFEHCYELPQPLPKVKEEEAVEIPLSPDSRKYQLKMDLLQEKFDEVQSSNEMLRNRLLQVQKEITQHERLKRMLVYTLETKGDKYYKGSIEFDTEFQTQWTPILPTPDDMEKEKKKRERKERDRLREKARKAAKREAEKVSSNLHPLDIFEKAKFEADLALGKKENVNALAARIVAQAAANPSLVQA